MSEKPDPSPYMQRASQAIRRRWQQARLQIKESPHRSFKLTPRVRRRSRPQAAAEGWRLAIDSLRFLRQHKRIFLILGLLYAAISYLLVGGVSQVTFVALKQSALDSFGDVLDAATTATSLFSAAITGSLREESSELQQFMGSVLMIIFWLVSIWAVRMLSAGKHIKVRDALYNGPTPFLSTLCVLVLFAIQLIPAVGGIATFSIASAEGWLPGGVESMMFAGAAALLTLLSLYLVTGSTVAMAIVALPGMYPVQALSSARTLVSGRRWSIVLRLLVVIVLQILIWAVVLIPTFMIDGWLRFDWLPLVPVMIQLLTAFSLVFSVAYVYKLYRSLL